MFSSWHLPKVLIRKSAIRACSGASTLKDQYLGQVPGGGGKKKEDGGGAISKKHHFLAQLLERSKRAKKIGDSFDFPNRKELVGGGRKAWNIPLTPTTHSQTTRCPSTHSLPTPAWLHTHTTTTTTYKDFAPPVSSVPISISGLVVEYIVAIDVTRARFPADAGTSWEWWPWPHPVHVLFP